MCLNAHCRVKFMCADFRFRFLRLSTNYLTEGKQRANTKNSLYGGTMVGLGLNIIVFYIPKSIKIINLLN